MRSPHWVRRMRADIAVNTASRVENDSVNAKIGYKALWDLVGHLRVLLFSWDLGEKLCMYRDARTVRDCFRNRFHRQPTSLHRGPTTYSSIENNLIVWPFTFNALVLLFDRAILTTHDLRSAVVAMLTPFNCCLSTWVSNACWTFCTKAGFNFDASFATSCTLTGKVIYAWVRCRSEEVSHQVPVCHPVQLHVVWPKVVFQYL